MKLQMKFGFKKAVNGICHCYGFIIHGVLIYIFKHVVCRVPHAFHCVFIGDIEPEHDRRIYMAEVVEAKRLNLTAGARTLPSDVANVPIVAMTANAFEEDKQKAIRAGMNAHIAKPIEAGRLMETLSHILT